MAEYYAVLSKAVAGLEPSTPEARRAIYDKARNALIGQLKAIDPPLPTAEISRQRLELEEAIRRVERETAGTPGKAAPPPPPRAPRSDAAPVAASAAAAAAAAAPPPPSARAPSPPPSRPAAPASRPAPPNNDVFRRAVQNAERDDDELPRVERAPAPPPPPPPAAKADSSWADEPADRVPPAAPREPFRPHGYMEQPRDDEPRLAPDYDEDWDHTIPVPAFGDAEEEPMAPRGRRGRRARAAEPEPVAKARRSRLPMIILLVLIVAMLGAIGALMWSQRDMVADLAAGFSSGAETPPPAAPAPAPDVAATQASVDASGKDTGRLLDGGESDAGEGDVRVVTAGSDAGDAAGQFASASAARAVEPATSAPATTSPPQRAVLYEEPLDAAAAAAGVVAINASVTWTYLPNGINGPEIVGNVDVPDRNMKLKIAIRRNTDSTLPASHVVEVVVDTPSDFPGGGVRDVPRVVFKPAEDARGQPLIGASARVAPGFFWIALSGVDSDVQSNLMLLKDRVWIDLPLVYDSGQRAIVTIEKGEAGQQVFQTALSAWAG